MDEKEALENIVIIWRTEKPGELFKALNKLWSESSLKWLKIIQQRRVENKDVGKYSNYSDIVTKYK